MGRVQKKQKHFGKIDPLSLEKLLSKSPSDRSLIGKPGFSRIVYCNHSGCSEAQQLGYCDNYVTTTKYTLVSFLPKSLFEQFRRIANLYFLLCAFLSFTPLSPNSPVSSVLPLVVVVAVTMVKELIEDWKRRKQDMEVNNRKTKVHCGNGDFVDAKWKGLRVGDIVKVEKDEYFPADLILLSSSYDEAICYVETTNLDGETNLKLKQALEVTLDLNDDSMFGDFRAIIKCEDPNANLYSFIGNLDYRGKQHPLSSQQLLLRESKLRNTDFIFGVSIFTGHDTKAIQNSVAAPSKRSTMERKTDTIVFFLFFVLFFLSIIGSIYFGIVTNKDIIDDGTMTRWYLRPDDTTIYTDPRNASFAATLHFLRAVMLYGYLIPISLYVSIELVKVLQTEFINKDVHMYYEDGDKPAQARTSNLNEELGQVDVILSDKTGTLTCNSMEFVKCSIAGIAYGQVVTTVEQVIAKRKALPLVGEIIEVEQPTVRGYNFVDDRITNGNWVNEQRSDVIQKFFRVMAICHTVIPVMDEQTGSISYEAESPDEAALVIAARELGFEFCERTHSSISIRELNPFSGAKVERTFELLNIIEFSSSRKRMSVIVKNEEGKLLLLCKGADSVMFERLAYNGREFERQTRDHVIGYAEVGLRTLVLAYREVDEDEYVAFSNAFMEAKSSVSAEREKLVEEVAENFEKNLILLGATAVEDKLQKGVPECIEKLAQAGIKLWVLTGDKMETAINVGYACSLLREGMRKIVINIESNQAKASEKVSNKSAVYKVMKTMVLQDIKEAKELLYLSQGSSEATALIIDGRSLSYALEDDVKQLFLELAMGCASVICCRSSPKQKALVTRLVKTRRGTTTLAIGDGGNDVGMLQEAHIGIGISGFEGMQAVMASDIAIAQFRFLERLLLVHGHWFCKRISTMICYFFYKNMLFGFTLFFYEAYTSFSGEPAYNEWYLTLYNIMFTSFPVIALGVLDQDVSAQSCLKFPQLYQEGAQNILFGWQRILGWLLNGILGATTIFHLCIFTLANQAFRKDGEVAGYEVLGATIYTCVIWVVNAQMALSVKYFTLIHHVLIWGSILSWYIFLLAYGAIDPYISTTAYKVFIEACAPSPSFWVVTLLVSVFALVPYFIYAALNMEFFPLYHQRLTTKVICT
ncbi:putative phospholipid-transporting ATPase 9 isoform X2 [Amaranthus tricolor]|uniref:putative phospholipid-transporting ATPase 9 isoform X2 n=1 Tax=Amaranthus tricolor TaxID=29722 RepID=UPI0025911BB2|nr:putative phospholipid-transporting ATPase 9 isoform X2 [Amaranthus tricolor]